MPVTVLVVDDSAFFRQRLSTILKSDPRVELVGTAENGQVAVEKAKELKPDVITMDYEMPVMNGMAALSTIMKECPTSVLMFSSLTYEGARITLEALEAGAVDFLPKNYDQLTADKGVMTTILIEKILAVARTRRASSAALKSRPQQPAAGISDTASRPTLGTAQKPVRKSAIPDLSTSCSLVAIGTSTGGPVAIQKVLRQLPANFPVPIVVVQHMPQAFTGAFAERLNQQCKIEVKEAADGDRLQKGVALLAPGGMQMMLEGRTGTVRIFEGDERVHYKPSVDITFGSASKVFPGKVLGIILTGMGADGREGSRMLKSGGSHIWAESEESCVIYGMPQAVVDAGLADMILDLNEVGGALITAFKA